MAAKTSSAQADKRSNLRGQLFKGEAKNTPGKKLDEEEWLVPNWEVYVKLNFELPDPGPDGAVKELRKMVETTYASFVNLSCFENLNDSLLFA